MEDIEILKNVAKVDKNILVIGAGLVGLDCVSGLLEYDVNIIVVEMAEWMLVKQLDKKAAKTYQEAFVKKGVIQYYGTGITEVVLDGAGNAVSVILGNGTEVSCEYIVVTAGVRSNISFLEGTGIEINRFGLVYVCRSTDIKQCI